MYKNHNIKLKNKNMRKINKSGIDIIKSFEGLRYKAYLCPSKIWTIGYGNTFYEDGTKVKEGDIIGLERASQLLDIILLGFEKSVLKYVKSTLNDNQYSALVSFCYNVGLGNLSKSTLLKKVNINPNDPSIEKEFMKWNKSKGIILKGLTRRRIAESKLYFKK